MAKIIANFAFNQYDLNVNKLSVSRNGFIDDEFLRFNGISYRDAYTVNWDFYGDYYSIFAGEELTPYSFPPSGQVQAYYEIDYGFNIPVLILGVYDLDVSGIELFSALQSRVDHKENYRSILSGDDTFDLSGASDNAFGLDGNDLFTGRGGNDFLDGGLGQDTAKYLGNQSNYTLTFGQNSTSILDRRLGGGEGTDTLISIEKLTFADRTLDLTNYSSLTQLNDAQFSDLAKVYVAYFNRAADAEGLYFWADKLAEGMDMPTIASYFSQSAEAKALYPNTADTSAFVTAVYANVLGRTPDQAGFDFWTTNLNNGSMQPATFVLSIIGGAQGADITYLSNKADLGVYFAAIKGMSDVSDAQNVLNIFGDQATSNTGGAKASVDGHYSDATASGGGEFIFELVGIVNDPFAGVI